MAEWRAQLQETRCCNLLFWSFLVLLFLAPLPYGSNRPWAWGGLESGIFLLVALRAIREVTIQDNTPLPTQFRWPVFWLFLWSLYPLCQVVPLPESVLATLSPGLLEIRRLAGWTNISGPFSVDSNATLQDWLKGMAYFGGFWLTLMWTHSYQRTKQLLYLLLVSGAAQALYGLMMIHSDPYKTVSGTFVNRNHLAGLLELTIPVGLGLMIGWMKSTHNPNHGIRETVLDWLQTTSSRKGILSVVLVVMFLAEFLTQSRSGNVTLLLSLLVVTVLAGWGHASNGSVSREKRLLVPLLTISILVGVGYGLGNLTGRLLNTNLLTEGRWTSSLTSWEIIKDFQWFGTGSGTFGFVYPLYRTGELSYEFLDHAHNDHAELLVEQGIIGYGLLAIGITWVWWTILQGYWHRRDPFVRGVLFASLSGTLALILHGLFDFNFHIPSNALYFMVLLAMGLGAVILPPRQ